MITLIPGRSRPRAAGTNLITPTLHDRSVALRLAILAAFPALQEHAGSLPDPRRRRKGAGRDYTPLRKSGSCRAITCAVADPQNRCFSSSSCGSRVSVHASRGQILRRPGRREIRPVLSALWRGSLSDTNRKRMRVTPRIHHPPPIFVKIIPNIGMKAVGIFISNRRN